MIAIMDSWREHIPMNTFCRVNGIGIDEIGNCMLFFDEHVVQGSISIPDVSQNSSVFVKDLITERQCHFFLHQKFKEGGGFVPQLLMCPHTFLC